RMRNLLLRQEDHDSEMTVVRNELERGEDEPQDLLQKNIFATAFLEHPYHHPVIGWRTDVENEPVKRLRQFYDEFYWPNNATLIVIGDIDAKQILEKVAQRFGNIPRSPQPFPNVYTQEPKQEGTRRFIVQRGSDLPRVDIAFHTVKAKDKDDYVLDVIESVLGDETKKSSRLYKALVDSGLASEADSSNMAMKDPGLFDMTATANAQTKPEALEAALMAQLEQLKTTPLTAQELERTKKSLLKRLKLAMSDPMGMANQVSEAVSAADWQYLARYPELVSKVSAADVQNAARKYFIPSNMTVGYYLPASKPQAEPAPGPGPGNVAQPTDVETNPADATRAVDGAQPGSPSAVATEPLPTAPKTSEPPRQDKVVGPKAGTPLGTASGVKVPPPSAKTGIGKFSARVSRFVLGNGLTLLVMPVRGTGTVAISSRVRAGQYFSTPQNPELPDLLSDLLTAGSSGYSKELLAQKMEEMGTNLAFNDDDFWLGSTSEVVTEDVANFLPLLADTLKHPVFSDEELQKTKKIKVAGIKEEEVDTGSVAWNRFTQSWYKPRSCYYNKPFSGQIADIESIDVRQLQDFHNRHFVAA
ncbi:MAG: insulinase family protein, partial [Terriglobales bacterium]